MSVAAVAKFSATACSFAARSSRILACAVAFVASAAAIALARSAAAWATAASWTPAAIVTAPSKTEIAFFSAAASSSLTAALSPTNWLSAAVTVDCQVARAWISSASNVAFASVTARSWTAVAAFTVAS